MNTGYITNINGEGAETAPLMAKVCPECPWRKKDAVNHHQPVSAERIFDVITKFPMACHMSQRELMAFTDNGVLRCRGVATYLANTNCGTEVLPDPETVFANKAEAQASWPPLRYHDWEQTRIDFFRRYPHGDYTDENDILWVHGTKASGAEIAHHEKKKHSKTRFRKTICRLCP